MTTARAPQRVDGWTAAVRQRLGLGRLLPLGEPANGVWIAETAAAAVLRGATNRPGTVLGKLRIGPTEEAVEAAVAGARSVSRDPAEPVSPPAPPNALPPVPLRIEAEFSTTPDRPLPDAAAALRTALLAAATARLGLEVAEVDLVVTALLEDGTPDQVTAADTAPAARVAEPEGAVATAAAGVPGVVSLTRVLGGPVHTAPDHVRVEMATAGDHRALDVARSVRTAVAAAMADPLPVSVLVTDVVEPGSGS
ncbi:hypothetical protein G3I43_35725 [Streptomyces anulatus]|uniref:Nucleopolyhedrovirus P10 family protein n=1 Tax=Streptomyces anulatus TaxID=1892 RepID=A0A6G3T2H6_STRAQ|nr:hypothetical protein [Streptomyces anulatus]NDZ58017.1 hypothetical protein [Streptomyces anulatus]NEB89467.1 hypothetical protein [Streptomyces anulatus]